MILAGTTLHVSIAINSSVHESPCTSCILIWRFLVGKSVHLVELKGTGELYAMKAMEKTMMLNRNKVYDGE